MSMLFQDLHGSKSEEERRSISDLAVSLDAKIIKGNVEITINRTWKTSKTFQPGKEIKPKKFLNSQTVELKIADGEFRYELKGDDLKNLIIGYIIQLLQNQIIAFYYDCDEVPCLLKENNIKIPKEYQFENSNYKLLFGSKETSLVFKNEDGESIVCVIALSEDNKHTILPYISHVDGIQTSSLIESLRINESDVFKDIPKEYIEEAKRKKSKNFYGR